MANNPAVISIVVNGQQQLVNVNQLLSQSFQGTQQLIQAQGQLTALLRAQGALTAQQRTQAQAQLAAVTQGMNAIVTAGTQANATISQMTQAQQVLNAQLQNVAPGTAQFRALQAQLLQVNNALNSTQAAVQGIGFNESLEAFGKFAQGVAGGFGLVQVALQNLGGAFGLTTQDVEDYKKTLLEIITVQQSLQQFLGAFSQGNVQLVRTLQASIATYLAQAAAARAAAGATGGLTLAQQALNLVMKANPYVLIATGILAAVTAVVAFSAATKDAEQAQLRLNAAIAAQNFRTNQEISEKAAGLEDKKASAEIEASRQKVAKDQQALADLKNRLSIAQASKASVAAIAKIQAEINATEKRIADNQLDARRLLVGSIQTQENLEASTKDLDDGEARAKRFADQAKALSTDEAALEFANERVNRLSTRLEQLIGDKRSVERQIEAELQKPVIKNMGEESDSDEFKRGLRELNRFKSTLLQDAISQDMGDEVVAALSNVVGLDKKAVDAFFENLKNAFETRSKNLTIKKDAAAGLIEGFTAQRQAATDEAVDRIKEQNRKLREAAEALVQTEQNKVNNRQFELDTAKAQNKALGEQFVLEDKVIQAKIKKAEVEKANAKALTDTSDAAAKLAKQKDLEIFQLEQTRKLLQETVIASGVEVAKQTFFEKLRKDVEDAGDALVRVQDEMSKLGALTQELGNNDFLNGSGSQQRFLIASAQIAGQRVLDTLKANGDEPQDSILESLGMSPRQIQASTANLTKFLQERALLLGRARQLEINATKQAELDKQRAEEASNTATIASTFKTEEQKLQAAVSALDDRKARNGAFTQEEQAKYDAASTALKDLAKIREDNLTKEKQKGVDARKRIEDKATKDAEDNERSTQNNVNQAPTVAAETMAQKLASETAKYAQYASTVVGMYMDIITMMTQQAIDRVDASIQDVQERISKLQEQETVAANNAAATEQKLNDARDGNYAKLKQQLDAELAQRNTLQNAILAQEEERKKLEAEKTRLEKQANRERQQQAIAQATINGAVAATRAFADLGPIAGPIFAGIIAALTVAEVATIANQKFAKGGWLEGRSHAQGGINLGGGREAEGNEFIVNKTTMASSFGEQIVAMNEWGARRMEVGGGSANPAAFSSPNAAQLDTTRLEGLMQQFIDKKIFLALTQFHEENDKYVKTLQSATL